MGSRRSMRLNVTIGGMTPPPRVSTTGTTAMATMVATRNEVHGFTTMARAVQSKVAHGTKATTQAMSLHAQRVAKPSPSLTPLCIVRRAAHSRGPACSCRAAHSYGLVYSCGPACFHGIRSSPNWPKTISTIWTNYQVEGIFTIFPHGFDISQLKSYAWSLLHFHYSRRHIPSKLFQSKWRTTLVSTSHTVDERPCTINDLGESTFATHRNPTCRGQGIPK
ncbi:hypothetical protein ACFX16_045373 [Malus domestica]